MRKVGFKSSDISWQEKKTSLHHPCGVLEGKSKPLVGLTRLNCLLHRSCAFCEPGQPLHLHLNRRATSPWWHLKRCAVKLDESSISVEGFWRIESVIRNIYLTSSCEVAWCFDWEADFFLVRVALRQTTEESEPISESSMISFAGALRFLFDCWVWTWPDEIESRRRLSIDGETIPGLITGFLVRVGLDGVSDAMEEEGIVKLIDIEVWWVVEMRYCNDKVGCNDSTYGCWAERTIKQEEISYVNEKVKMKEFELDKQGRGKEKKLTRWNRTRSWCGKIPVPPGLKRSWVNQSILKCLLWVIDDTLAMKWVRFGKG